MQSSFKTNKANIAFSHKSCQNNSVKKLLEHTKIYILAVSHLWRSILHSFYFKATFEKSNLESIDLFD